MTRRLLNNAWIFVSHSNRDIVTVRRIRNRLERLGAQPILFLLRSAFAKPELRQLVFREIEARNFFLYCRSAHAERSHWVQKEVGHVKSLLPGKVYIEIDLDWSWQQQSQQIDILARASTVFLSYSRHDQAKVSWFERLLVHNEFTVFGDDDIEPGALWEQKISKALVAVAESGYFILFLSRAAPASSWVMAELEQALALDRPRRKIIVVELEPMEPAAALPRIAEFQLLKYDEDLERQSLRLLELLGLGNPSVRSPDERVDEEFDD